MPCERCGRRCEGRLCSDCGTETRQALSLPPMGATFESDDGDDLATDGGVGVAVDGLSLTSPNRVVSDDSLEDPAYRDDGGDLA